MRRKASEVAWHIAWYLYLYLPWDWASKLEDIAADWMAYEYDTDGRIERGEPL